MSNGGSPILGDVALTAIIFVSAVMSIIFAALQVGDVFSNILYGRLSVEVSKLALISCRSIWSPWHQCTVLALVQPLVVDLNHPRRFIWSPSADWIFNLLFTLLLYSVVVAARDDTPIRTNNSRRNSLAHGNSRRNFSRRIRYVISAK